MTILDGKKISEEILSDLKREIKAKRLKLTLAVIQVGGDSVSRVFVEQKKKACEKIGVNLELFKFPAKIKNSEFKKEIKKIITDPVNSGVIIQLPVPKKFQPEEEFTNLIPEEKDVDVLSEKGFMKFFRGTSPILPPVVGGIDFLLKKYGIKLRGKNVVIMGAGKLTGMPSAIWALQKEGTVSVVTASTQKPSYFTEKADILISGAGKPGLIKGNMVKKEVVVVDCGTNLPRSVLLKAGLLRGKIGKKMKGDVDFKTVARKASYITPVPGGMGPMTVAMVLWNLIKMNKK